MDARQQDRLFGFGLFLLTASGAYVFSGSLDRSIWLDEAWVANSILSEDWVGMFYYDNWLQTSPPLFLVVVRIAAWLAGESEAALRLIPVMFSVASVSLLGLLARRLMSPPWALLCAASLVASPDLPVLSQWVKQYTADLFAAVLLLYLCARYLQGRSNKDLATALLAYVPLSLLSYTAVFAAPVLLYGALFRPGRLRLDLRPPAVAGAVAVAATVLASALLSWVAFIAPNRSDALDLFWSASFILEDPLAVSKIVVNLPILIATSDLVRWLDIPADKAVLVRYGLAVVAAALVVLGFVDQVRRRPLPTDRLALLCLPLMSAVALNLAYQYPFEPRLLMATLPGAILLFVLGLRYAVSAAGERRSLRGTDARARAQGFPAAGPVALALVVAATLLALARDDGELREDVASAMGYIGENLGEGDTLYVAADMHEQFLYYNRRQPLAAARIVYGDVGLTCCRREPVLDVGEPAIDREVEAMFSASRNAGRLFAMFTSRKRSEPFPEEEYVGKLVDRGCSLPERMEFTGVSVLALDCRPSPGPVK